MGVLKKNEQESNTPHWGGDENMSTRREALEKADKALDEATAQADKALDEARAPAWKAYEEAMARAEELPENA